MAMCRLVCIWWELWAWHPPVGVWMGILGFLGVLVALIRDLTKIGNREKATWIFIMFALLMLEMKSVYQDRNEHDQQQADARDRETKSFETIAEGITGAIRESDTNFAAVMQRSNRILVGVGDTIKTETGGDSFAFITFTPEQRNVQFGQLAAPAGTGPYFLVSITSHGKYPLKDIHATMMDDERRIEAMVEYNKHPDADFLHTIQSADTYYRFPYLRPQSPERPSGDVEAIGTYPLFKGDSKRLTIAFSSLNGAWNEVLHLGAANGSWHQCLSVMGPTAKQVTTPFIYCDSDWPEGKALAEKDWVFPKRQAH